MHPILRNILAVLTGLIAGSIINMGLVNLGGSVIPPPHHGKRSAAGVYSQRHLAKDRSGEIRFSRFIERQVI